VFPGDLRGYHVVLAVEVSDTSLAYDRGRKIGVYAAFGIPEVWVIDANTLVTRAHRDLGAEGYRAIVDVLPDDQVTALREKQIFMCLSRLGLTPSGRAARKPARPRKKQ
jgi:Uma2 family endonuclease